MRKLLLAGLIAASPAAAQVPQINIDAQAPVIGVSVNEFVESSPDLALFDVGVSTLAPTATQAVTENARQMERVIARVRAAGVSDRDIQTTGINLHPQHRRVPPNAEGIYPPAAIAGYNASNNIRIRYRKLKEVGALIDALVAAGANNINGPTFTIEEPEARVREARDKALVAAEQRANEYARRVGARSVRLLSITEGAQGRHYGGGGVIVTGAPRGSGGAGAPPPPPRAPGVAGAVAPPGAVCVHY